MARFNKFYIFTFVIINIAALTTDANRAISDIVEALLDPRRYNSRARPAADKGTPLNVHININVNDISSISEVHMEYRMTLYLRQVWRDERLAYRTYNKNITLNHNQFERLWTPDVFIRNLKQGIFHTITVPNRLIRLSPNGEILYSQRLTLTLACDMILDKYPMDNQTCNIEFGSYAYTTEDLVFLWRTDAKAVEMNRNISLPEYLMTGVTHEVCGQTMHSTGSFPCLKAHFHLERRLRAYILTTYLPSFLVVLLSWLSFWIDLESAPARTSLSILTILTITTQSSGLLRNMPAGSFTKAVDVWMATCLVFVFGAFIEYSIVNTLARRQKAQGRAQSATPAASNAACKCAACMQDAAPLNNTWNDEHITSSTPLSLRKKSQLLVATPPLSGRNKSQLHIKCPPPSVPKSTGWFSTDLKNDKAVMVEVISRALFPLMFLVFNLIYWPWYLYM